MPNQAPRTALGAAEPGISDRGGGPLLVVEGLTRVFPSPDGPLHALGPIDLSVERREFVALVGPSGCGKSTLFNIVAGIEPATSGDARVDGRSVVLRPGSVAYMPQKDLLLPWLRVLDNAALPLELAGVPRREARQRAAAFFPRFGLSGFERNWPWQLSGGMRQRAALLRTYLLDRELLLLDEPFGALDAMTRAEMHEWLLSVWEEDRRAVLFVTHDVDEALRLADRVCVMSPRPGRIVGEVTVPFGRPRSADPLADPRYVDLRSTLLDRLHRSAERRAAGRPG